MKKSFLLFLTMILLAFTVTACGEKTEETAAETTAEAEETKAEAAVEETEAAAPEEAEPVSNAEWKVGVGAVDITPDEPVQTVGGVAAVDVTEQDTPLMIKAAVIEAGDDKAVIVTIDTLKYPNHEEAVRKISELGFDKENIMISASHTHSAPYYTYYFDNMEDEIVEAVKLAQADLEPVTLGAASTKVSDVSGNRRLIDPQGSAWNNWFVPDSVRATCTNPGPLDEEMVLLTATKADGKVKAVIWNFADHPCSYSEAKLSADFPGHVQENVNDLLGYDAMTLFVNGAAGDINPTASTDTISDKMAAALVAGVKNAEPIEMAKIAGLQEKLVINDREVEFAEEEISKKWPDQLEGYRSNYENTKKKERSNNVYINAIAFGDMLVIASEPGELFCQYGLDVKESSSFPYTMIAEATNGFMGYIPTLEDFEEGGYETWYGEHSFLAEDAGDQIAKTMKKLVKEVGKEQGVSSLVSGLKMELHKLVDTTNVIVKFNKEAYGCTEKVNYTVTDADGKQYAVTSATSAFAELGGEVPNVFKLSFAEELPEGEYTIKASNLYANTSDTSPIYKPCETTFTIGDGVAKGKGVSGDVTASFIKTVNNKNVIIRFSEPVDGCTDAENYKVEDKSGKAYTVKEAKSAFAELGGEIPDVFRITTEEAMPDGDYVISVNGLTGSSGQLGEIRVEFRMGGAAAGKAGLQAMMDASFPATDVTMGLVKVNDKASVTVVFSTPLEGCTEANQYMVVDAAGNVYTVKSARSAFAELNGEIPDVFRITTEEALPVGKYTVYAFGMLKGTAPVGYMSKDFEITATTAEAKTGPITVTAIPFKYLDRSNIIIKFSEDAGGFTEPANYTVVGDNGLSYKPVSVTSAFTRTGGTDTNVFNMYFNPGLPNGKYTLTVTGITDGAFECAPVTLTFNVPGSVEFLAGTNQGNGKSGASSAGGGGGGSDSGKKLYDGLNLSILGKPDSKYVIVKFDRAVNGSTETVNYKLVDSDGKSITITSATSAFAQTGVPNSFKLTFKELDPGTYTVTASNQYEAGKMYKPVSADFEIVDTTQQPSTAWLKFAQPLEDGNYSITLNNLKEGGQTLNPITVNFTVGDAPQTLNFQTLSLQGAGDVDPLEVTVEVVDRSNVLVKFNRSPKGVSTVSNYAVKNEDTQQPVAAPTMEFVEDVDVQLAMIVYKVVDKKNVIVRFNMDMNGATETVNYVVKNEDNEVMEISKVASAFQELGGSATNVFKITFKNELPEGEYTVLAKNLSKNGQTLAPVSDTFSIGGVVEEKLKGLTLTVMEEGMDSKHVIVRFNKATEGATEVSNYTVKNSKGEVQEITSVTSAYVELDKKYTNVFKITFKNALADDHYKVYAKNQTDPTLMKPYETVSAGYKWGDVEDVYMVGVGSSDITPEGSVPLAGNTSSTMSTGKDTNLYVKAVVIDSGLDRVVFITVDTLKFPEQSAAIKKAAELAGVPEENVYITASHTHSAPLYTRYYDNFQSNIIEAVTEALNDMEECQLVTASGSTTGLTQNRRYLDNDGQAWNEWFAPQAIKNLNKKSGPEDEEIEILAAVDGDDQYKAILWNYACHACSNLNSTISADYPGHVQEKVNDLLGYETMTFYMTGAAGNVNPDLSKTSMTGMGNTIGSAIVTALGKGQTIEAVSISSHKSFVTVEKRDATFAEAEITQKWPEQLEHYRTEFNNMKKAEQDSYELPVSAVSIGGKFVLSANSGEMFCENGLSIKSLVPVGHVMIAEATNGFSGYMPMKEDFAEGGYETWYGEHSFLEEDAAEMIRVACIEEISTVTGIEIDPDAKTDLELTVYKVEDGNNVVVQFSKEVDGCTEKGNYIVTDSNGTSYTVTGAASAWADYQVPNSFRITLAKDLPAGEITVIAQNMYKGEDKYAPASVSFELMELKVYSVPSASSVIVQFPKEVDGCTTAANYVVKNEAGVVQTVSTAASAYQELGGVAPNVFKLTFSESLAAGKYTVYAKNIIDGGNMVVTGAAEFETEGELQTGLTASIYKIEDSKNIVVQFNKEVNGFTEASNYEVKDKDGKTVAVTSAVSAWTDYQAANSFRITLAEAPTTAGVYTITAKNMYDGGGKYQAPVVSFGILGFSTYKIVDSQHVIVQFNCETVGATEVPYYTVVDEDGNAKTVTAVASAYSELGGVAANVFKLTFSEALPAKKYTITVSNQMVGTVKYAPASCEFELFQEDLSASIYKIEDSKNIVLQFSKEVNGFTEASNYEVKDKNGNTVAVTSAVSTWTDYQVPNSFRITLAEAPVAGPCEITAKNMYDGGGKYKPITLDFGVLGMSTYKIVDNQHVIVQLSCETVGATEVPFYTVVDEDGNAKTVTAVASAYQEIGGAAPNVFKLTFSEALPAKKYTVTVNNQTVGGVKYSPATCEFELFQEDLSASIYKIEDNKNIVVQFSKEVNGFTEASNYEVKDKNGNTVAVTSAVSTWTDYQVPNSFRITLAEAPVAGSCEITAKNMYDGGGKYKAITLDFGVLGMSTYQIVDSQHVIVQLSCETVGATEVPFYTVVDEDGNAKTVTSVASAFQEIGGAAANVFKLTFSEALPAKKYTVTVNNQTVGGVKYSPATCEFELFQEGLTASVYKVEDDKNIVVQFNKDVNGCTEASFYTVEDPDGNEIEVTAAASAWSDYQQANSFRITLAEGAEKQGVYKITASNMYDAGGKYKAVEVNFGVLGLTTYKIVDDQHVIVQYSCETVGATEVPFYKVTDEDGNEETVTAVASAFQEIGGVAGNVFKLTFSDSLGAGKYTITASGQTVSGVKYAPASCEFELFQEGLTASVYKIEDDKNIVVQFNKDVNGCTEASFYTVEDPDGNEIEVTAAASAWSAYQQANSFRITLAEGVEKQGVYKITASNMYDAGGKYKAVEVNFGVLGLTTYKVVDDQHVIVQFSCETIGATETAFYKVTDADGNEYTVSGVASAFQEIGGAAANVFKLTFSEELPAKEYTITASGQTVGGVKYAPASCEFELLQDGLTLSVYKIEDDKNIVVQFNKEVDGCTEAAFYTVEDPDENVYTVSSAASAWADYQVPNSFRITLAESADDLGVYEITASDMYDAGGKYKPVSVSFGVLGLETYKVVDDQHVIVQFSCETEGATETAFYKVTDADGNEYAVSSVASAFLEIGGEAPNVFKLTFSEALDAGTYTVTASGQTVGGVKYAPASCEFETLQNGLSASVYKAEDNQNIVIQFNKAVDGCTEASNYTVTDPDGNEYSVSGAASAWVDYQQANSFRITMSDDLTEGVYTITASNMYDEGGKYKAAEVKFGVLSIDTYEVKGTNAVIIQMSCETIGATETAYYTVTDEGGNEQTISGVASAFQEIGGAAPNVFKISFSSALEPGTYTVHVKGQIANSIKYCECECEFEVVEAQTLAALKAPIEVQSEKDTEEVKESETEVIPNEDEEEEEENEQETAALPEEVKTELKDEEKDEEESNEESEEETPAEQESAKKTAESLPELEEL